MCALGCPDSRSRLDSRAGGTNGRTTAAVISDPATVDCSLLAGLVACAEKCRIAVCATELDTTTGRAIMSANVIRDGRNVLCSGCESACRNECSFQNLTERTTQYQMQKRCKPGRTSRLAFGKQGDSLDCAMALRFRQTRLEYHKCVRGLTIPEILCCDRVFSI